MMSEAPSITDVERAAKLLTVNLPDPDKGKVLDIMVRSGAILEGHFSFLDCHSSNFLHLRYVGNKGNEGRENTDYLASLLVGMAGIDPDEETPLKVFSSETSGSMFLAGSVGKMFVVNKNSHFKKVVLVHSEFRDKGPQLSDRFVTGNINPGNRVVIVGDIDRTGKSIDNLIKTVRRCKATVEAVLLFAVCNAAKHKQRMEDMGVKSYYLAEFNGRFIEGTGRNLNCPGCEQGLPVLPVSTLL